LGLKFKGHKMKQTPLTNMEGRWVHSTKEAFYALVEMGYRPYTDTYLGYEKLEVSNNGIIFQGSVVDSTSKQTYYHNGHFYDQPYEEFTITEEKAPFPELEDIEEFTGPEWWIDLITRFYSINGELIYKHTRIAYENGVPVTWKLKPKIDRRLHKNRPLALAIGSALLLGIINPVPCQFDSIAAIGSHNGMLFYCGSDGERREVTIPDDYIIPDQVLQWMKEYDHTS